MKLFQNKYKRRILNKINELVKFQSECESEQLKYRQTLNPKEYCHWSVIIGDIKKDIELLKGLIN